ncbi:unnamed protein product [Peronospora destructor]|uniref:Uncharacterized protein n=1 Tax=Peronospora destructor TaxID=86335 RepID=A0AAV0V6D6_9STRA|nr:unnamed protein product [Peronospora destructor]
MSDRLLTRFQQDQEDENKRCILFQHVAAKFDGVRLDGGLGTLGVTSIEGGGIVWLEERRRKELEDVTHETNKSTAALFLSIAQVTDVLPTIVQNAVKGVEIQLVDHNRLELTFMPGELVRIE